MGIKISWEGDVFSLMNIPFLRIVFVVFDITSPSKKETACVHDQWTADVIV